MTEIRTKPFREAHLDIFHVADSHRADCWAAAKQWHHLGSLLQAGSHMIDGRIVYISCFIPTTPGVVEVWMHPSIYVPQYKLAVIKHVKWWLQDVAERCNARRIQTWGDTSAQSDRWLAYLGFKCEGVLQSFRPDGGPASVWSICKPSPASLS